MGDANVFRRVRLLGGPVDIATRDEVLAFIADSVAASRKAIVGNQNLHSLELSQTNASLRAFFDMADLIEIDSMPLLHWGRLLGLPLTASHRSTYLDWRSDFWNIAARRGWRVFLLGATEAVNDGAVARLEAQWPGVRLRGLHGYFDHRSGGSDNAAVVSQINAFRPDVLLVGLGMPLQETWIRENYADIGSGVMLSIGAAFDYEAGAQKPAPRIYGMLCLEWLFRLVHDPRRLFRRYLIEPWNLVAPAVADLLGGPVPPRQSVSGGALSSPVLAEMASPE